MEVKKIKLKQIKLGQNSRLNVSDDEIAGLMGSITEMGLLQPIGVMEKNGGYEVTYGNRRFIALSKLGYTEVPCVILGKQDQSEADLKNLAENIQRRNISLQEVGRYIEKLTEDGLSHGEIAVRLGVTKNYVSAAANAFQQVPEKFRKDVVPTIGTGRLKAGKMSISTVRKIETARRKFNLKHTQKLRLYEIAKADGFDPNKVSEYCSTLLNDERQSAAQVVEAVKNSKKTVTVPLSLSQKDYDKVRERFIEKGPFKSMTEVLRAKVVGKINFSEKLF